MPLYINMELRYCIITVQYSICTGILHGNVWYLLTKKLEKKHLVGQKCLQRMQNDLWLRARSSLKGTRWNSQLIRQHLDWSLLLLYDMWPSLINWDIPCSAGFCTNQAIVSCKETRTVSIVGQRNIKWQQLISLTSNIIISSKMQKPCADCLFVQHNVAKFKWLERFQMQGNQQPDKACWSRVEYSGL